MPFRGIGWLTRYDPIFRRSKVGEQPDRHHQKIPLAMRDEFDPQLMQFPCRNRGRSKHPPIAAVISVDAIFQAVRR